MNYQLEIKQIADYPRYRIYREFSRSLMEDGDSRTNGDSYLFITWHYAPMPASAPPAAG